MMAPSPWVIADRTGHLAECATRADWLAEWSHRIRAIETADRPVERRREGLERSLFANAAAFHALVKHGALDAVIDVTGMAAVADTRLSRMEIQTEIVAAR